MHFTCITGLGGPHPPRSVDPGRAPPGGGGRRGGGGEGVGVQLQLLLPKLNWARGLSPYPNRVGLGESFPLVQVTSPLGPSI